MGQVCDTNSSPPAAAQMDLSLFSTCLPLQLCTLISRLHRRVFPLFHKEKTCHDYSARGGEAPFVKKLSKYWFHLVNQAL